jgi:hypothetical protein
LGESYNLRRGWELFDHLDEISSKGNYRWVCYSENIRFRQIGFTFVAMDLAGYRRGSLNEGQALIQIAVQ